MVIHPSTEWFPIPMWVAAQLIAPDELPKQLKIFRGGNYVISFPKAVAAQPHWNPPMSTERLRCPHKRLRNGAPHEFAQRATKFNMGGTRHRRVRCREDRVGPCAPPVFSSPLVDHESFDEYGGDGLKAFIAWCEREYKTKAENIEFQEAYQSMRVVGINVDVLKGKNAAWFVSQGVKVGTAERIARSYPKWHNSCRLWNRQKRGKYFKLITLNSSSESDSSDSSE
jgi:hypothetical protein